MLEFYLYSTLFSAAITIISGLAIKARLKREGYVMKFETSIWEKLYAWMHLVIPILNILIALAFVFKHEEVYKGQKEKYYTKEE